MGKKLSCCCENCSHCTYIHEYETHWCLKHIIPISAPQHMICDGYDDEDGEADS